MVIVKVSETPPIVRMTFIAVEYDADEVARTETASPLFTVPVAKVKEPVPIRYSPFETEIVEPVSTPETVIASETVMVDFFGIGNIDERKRVRNGVSVADEHQRNRTSVSGRVSRNNGNAVVSERSTSQSIVPSSSSGCEIAIDTHRGDSIIVRRRSRECDGRSREMRSGRMRQYGNRRSNDVRSNRISVVIERDGNGRRFVGRWIFKNTKTRNG